MTATEWITKRRTALGFLSAYDALRGMAGNLTAAIAVGSMGVRGSDITAAEEDARTSLPCALDALEAVLEIHANEDISHLTGVPGSYNCPGCNHAGQGYCPTRLAIEATLGQLATTRKNPHDVE